MELVAKLDEYGKGAWIALMVLAFIVLWPVGLGILAFLIWSGRMACWKSGKIGRWHYRYDENGRSEGRSRHQARHESHHGGRTDNWAFNEYREETLRRLEEEQAEFETFLDRLRHAEDKAQFDRFMDERRNRAAPEDEAGSPEDGTGDGDNPGGGSSGGGITSAPFSRRGEGPVTYPGQ